MDNSSNVFNTIEVKAPNSSWFDLSHSRIQSQKIGDLVPCMAIEMLPGSVAKYSVDHLARLAPQLAPIMGKINVYTHTFFVPNRILWKNWKWFATGGNYPTDNPEPPRFDFDPNIPSGKKCPVSIKSLSDYLGLPVTGDVNENLGLPVPIITAYHQAYQRIWADYYRDQDLQLITDEEEALGYMFSEEDGTNNDDTWYAKLHTIHKRAYRQDYFTAARPFAQKGDPVRMPVTFTDAVVKSKKAEGESVYPMPEFLNYHGGGPLGLNGDDIKLNAASANPGSTGVSIATDNTMSYGVYSPNGDLYVNLTGQEISSTINDLRTAYSLQKWLEKNARAGSRYVELLKAHFNEDGSDARLQRPEYVCGSKSVISSSEVLQTAPATEEAPTPQGTMAGYSISVAGSQEVTYKAHEHGILMTICSVVPELVYENQGVLRQFTRHDRFDYAWPDFANTGEQEILNSELYVDFDRTPGYNNGTFGYIPRYSEYRWFPSNIAGEMRDISLSYWHTGRNLASPPSLNADFILVNDADYRKFFTFQDQDYDDVYISFYHNLQMLHPLPKYGTPLL